MKKIDVGLYYSENHEYEFLIAAYNLFQKADIPEFLNKYNFLDEKNKEVQHKKLHDLRVMLSDDLDNFNFSMITRLAIALELSLKGLALIKKINIFTKDKTRTLGLSYWIENLFSLLNQDDSTKYKNMFLFFRDNRNDFIHFSKVEYQLNPYKLVENIKNVSEYFDNIVLPLKEQASLRQIK